MPGLSLGLGASVSPKRTKPAPAPSGIPVASTNSIIVTNPINAPGLSFTLNKQGTPPNISYQFEVHSLYWDGSAWNQENTDLENGGIQFNQSASQNQNFIPTTGWPSGTTITAA